MIYLIWWASCKDDDAFEDRDDKLCIQSSLKESVHLRLLLELSELIKFDHFALPTGETIPYVPHLSPDHFISSTGECDEKSEETDETTTKVGKVIRAAYIQAIFIWVLVLWLTDVNEGKLKHGVDYDELKIALLDRRLDLLTHALGLERFEHKAHYDDR